MYILRDADGREKPCIVQKGPSHHIHPIPSPSPSSWPWPCLLSLGAGVDGLTLPACRITPSQAPHHLSFCCPCPSVWDMYRSAR